MTQSPLLTQFYQDYNAWLEGAPSPFFSRAYGLCFNLNNWAKKKLKLSLDARKELSQELDWQFDAAGLDLAEPFNHGNFIYDYEQDKRLNPRRVAWVKAHLEG